MSGGTVLKRLVPLAIAAAWFASPLLAQEHPNQARGFAADKVFSWGEVDQVNLFNGNLSLTVGIGQRYPLNAGFSYGLTLTYNSNLWKYEEDENFTPPDIFTPATVARPDPQSNGGFGWALHLGRLFAPGDPTFNDSTRWVWISGDGSRHSFYPTLHEGETPTANVYYSRDNTYLRLNTVARSIEMPDGTKHTFSTNSHVSKIEDRHGNYLNVNTSSATQWILSDSLGRTHTINFGSYFIEGTRQVSSVSLKAFDGQTATYTFDYENATFYRTCKDTWWGNNAGGQSSGLDQITVPLLRQINGPEGIVFKMQESPLVADYHRGAPPTQPECLYSGVIEGLELPTKGKLAWSWQLWRFPGFDSTPINPSNHHQRGPGVATRTVTDPWSGDGTWSYANTIFPDPGTLSNPSREVHTTVTDPEGNSVKHFFTAPQTLQGGPVWRGWEYGLPFTWDTSEAGKYLSSEIRDATNTVKRTQWVSYSHDLLGAVPFTEPALWYDTNRRVNAERTKFADDGNKVLDTTQADFDGLSHYRATTRASDFDPNVSDSRTTRVQWNGSRCYEVNLSTNQQTCTAANLVFQPPATTAPWVLDTFSYRQANQGGIARTFASFEAQTGFLLCERIVKTGTSIGANDVLILYEKDAGTGNVKSESFYGGDLQTLGTAANCTAPASFTYRVEHTYSAGVRSSSRYRRTTAANDFLPFYSFRADIDASTGFVKTAYDTASYPTALTYDTLGRLKMVAPHASAGASEKGAKTCYDYPAIGGGPARVKILRDVPSGSTCASSPFGESELTFDGFGRVWKERVKMADGSWSKRVTSYGAQGWKGSVSEQIPDATGDFFLPATRYQGFDAFGRPGKVLPPDAVDGNSPHAITLGYSGIRQVSRTVNVATAAGVETSSTTTETYDGHGRLLKVQEPNGAGTATVATTYQYDVGNRLTRVCQGASGSTCGQERLFGYDNRGFLLSETHPEKGGPVTYGSYDARGHAGFKTDGASANKLLYVYDKAERLKEVWEDFSPTDRLLKQWTYDTASGRGGGKLHQAQGYNYFTSPISATVNVIETYSYGEIEGRVSQKTTLNQFNSAAQELFTQTFDFDAGGNLLSQTYPSCANGACGSIAARPVTYAYANGYLTSVPGWASSISYHANGMVAAVAHSNLVTDTIDLEPADNWMQRPWKLGTSGVNFSQNFSTGEHSYDGAGNISSIGPSSFLYDKLSRLTSSTVYLPSWAGGSASQGYTFDAYGNLTSVTGTNARSTPTSAATNRLTGSGVAYDAAGNLTCWGGTALCNGTSYQFDKLNRLQRMTTAAGAAQEDWAYIYTADDERFWSLKLNGSGSLWTLRDLSGSPVRQFQAHLGWSKTKDSIYRHGQLLAADHPDEGVRHYHLDHLGSPRLTTNPSRAMVAHHTYFPFGEEVAGSTADGERLKFTGHERDLNNLGGAGDDLDYMHARFHSPVTGRFLSVDRALGRGKQPQTWNRYAYVAGNPLKYVDRDGLELQAFYLATGTLFDKSRHSALYFRNDEPGREVDLVFSHGGQRDGINTLQAYLGGYNAAVDPTTARRLLISEAQAEELFEEFKRGFYLTAQSLVDARSDYETLSNNCAQYVCNGILNSLEWDPVTGSLIEVVTWVGSLNPINPPVLTTNDGLAVLLALGVLGGIEKDLQPPQNAPRNVVIYWAYTGNKK